MAQKEGTKIIGKMECPVCGKVAPVKKSLRGRLSLVCKWQNDGCGAQLQTLTADASIIMLKKVVLIDDEPKGDEQQETEKKPKGKIKGKKTDETRAEKDEQPKHAPSVSESAGFGGFW